MALSHSVLNEDLPVLCAAVEPSLLAWFLTQRAGQVLVVKARHLRTG